MKILINVKLYLTKGYTMGDTSKYSLREILVDVTKTEFVPSVEVGFALRVLDVIRPICQMLRTFCTSSQFLAVLEAASYTVRESLERVQDWFHGIDYEDFQVVVETKLLPDHV